MCTEKIMASKFLFVNSRLPFRDGLLDAGYTIQEVVIKSLKMDVSKMPFFLNLTFYFDDLKMNKKKNLLTNLITKNIY